MTVNIQPTVGPPGENFDKQYCEFLHYCLDSAANPIEAVPPVAVTERLEFPLFQMEAGNNCL